MIQRYESYYPKTIRSLTVITLIFLCLVSEQNASSDEFRPTAQSRIIPAGAKLEIVYHDGEFTEGPTVAADGSILFSDIGNRILRFDSKSGKTTEFRNPSGRANGLMFDQKGRLIACEGANTGGGRRISLTQPDGKVRTLADRFEGKRFNSPNDLAIDSQGRVYFTDPRYVGDEPRELDLETIYLVDRSGKVTRATTEVKKPNGILVSLDGRHVYVSENNPQGGRQLLVFRVQSDGTLTDKKVLHDFGSGRGIDGMTLDRQGNIYATAGSGEKSGVYVFGPKGEHLARIPTPGPPTNCVFGIGEQIRTLYITGAGPKEPGKAVRYALFRITLANKGAHIFPVEK